MGWSGERGSFRGVCSFHEKSMSFLAVVPLCIGTHPVYYPVCCETMWVSHSVQCFFWKCLNITLKLQHKVLCLGEENVLSPLGM